MLPGVKMKEKKEEKGMKYEKKKYWSSELQDPEIYGLQRHSVL